MNDQMWRGGFITGPACRCGSWPDSGHRWAHYCATHGDVCGDCWRSGDRIGCPLLHDQR